MRTVKFEDLYIPEPNSGCWLWLGGRDGYRRYGYFSPRYQGELYAHRVSWLIHRGPIASGLRVCHKCDVTLCVNPDHLFLGTQQDNMDDMMRKGRRNAARGERVGGAKLTASDVISIRNDPRKQVALAAIFGVRRETISAIKRRRIWRHIEGQPS